MSSVFLKMLQNLDRFSPERASLSTWIYTIARHTVVDYQRQQQRNYLCELPEEMPVEDDVCEPLLRAELLEQLACGLESLEKRKHDLIVLRYYEGYSLKRVAEEMNLSYSCSKLIHQKALKCLREWLEE